MKSDPSHVHATPAEADIALPSEVRTEPLASADVERCMNVLERIALDRSLLAAVDEPTRRRLLVAAGRLSKPHRFEQRELAKTFRRKDRLEQKSADARLLDATGIRRARAAPVFVTPPANLPPGSEARREPAELREPRKCYVCKAEFRRVHFFYDSMCSSCGDFNYEKRSPSARLDGRVALVTGARVKIGFQTAIMLLRAGATVIVTTRFPHDAAERFAAEADWEAWGDRLRVHGLDLRHTPSVERFAMDLAESLGRLDILINNAAQTVRRPRGFYAHLDEIEARPSSRLSARARHALEDYARLRGEGRAPLLSSAAPYVALPASPQGESRRARSNGAALSLVPNDPENAARAFPAGRLDADLQQIDLRPNNSWRLRLGEVPTVELLEVQLVNSIAPFVLASKLRPAMLRSPERTKFIVNVSAVEGQFYRPHKTDKHPHTNMAKAALNMLTRTSAVDYKDDGIFMNSVDTGWVTDEDPIAIAERKTAEHGFHPPLDIVDGAARICDPVFVGVTSVEPVWGKFLKDYRETEW